ncbi:MAG: GNAT family N-acetyltransferase [Legionellaceae bacterium]|nr:GNAT family N-acetyltransferase [Legionellaceae bacterium]
MNNNLSYRKANQNDLEIIVKMLAEDELGLSREKVSMPLDKAYLDAFEQIDNDPNQYLMVVERENKVVGSCHLTMMPSLTFTGSTRMQFEGVRVSAACRGQKIGEWMIKAAIQYGVSRGASIIQLTTDKKRTKAKHFYESLGLKATHEGMKIYIGNKT